MVDRYRRAIRINGVWQYIRGASGIVPSSSNNRDLLVSGTYNPVDYSGSPALGGNYATNRVGIYDPSTLVNEVEQTTTKVYSTNGQTISNTHFYCRVSITGQNITFENCFFHGNPTDQGHPVSTGSAALNTTFIDCTFCPTAPQWGQYGVALNSGGGSLIRCDVYGTGDGACNISSTGWTNQWNFIQSAFHDFLYNSPFQSASQGINDNASHTDGIQWSGGKCFIDGCGIWGFFQMTKRSQANEPNAGFGTGSTGSSGPRQPYHFFGNKYTDTVAVAASGHSPAAVIGQPSIYTTSCVMLSPALAPVTRFVVQNSYLDGSTWAINVSPNYPPNFGGWAAGADLQFKNNKIGINHRWGQYGTNEAIIEPNSMHAGWSASGNTNLVNGNALNFLTQIVQDG